MAILKYINDEGQEDLVHVGPDRPEVLIGRAKECDLKTKNNTVSRKHAMVRYEAGRYVLRDLNSANGTFYRRQRITEATLDEGGIIICGTFQIEFRFDEQDHRRAGRPTVIPAPEAAERKAPEPQPPPPPPKQQPIEIPKVPSRPTEEVVTTLDYGAEVELLEVEEQVTFESRAPSGSTEPAHVGTVVEFQQRAEARRLEQLLAAEKDRETRIQALKEENERLSAEIEKREEEIRKLRAQIDDLSKVIARYEAAESTEDLRLADLERVLQATESERAALEEELAEQKTRTEQALQEAKEAVARAEMIASELAEVVKERDQLSARLDQMQAQFAEISSKQEELEKALESSKENLAAMEESQKRLMLEKSALEEEVQRWEALKKQFEMERTQARMEAEQLRKQLDELSAKLAQSSRAEDRVAALESQLATASQELAEVKQANRAYLKRISRLLEELEQAKARPVGPDLSQLEALRGEKSRLEAEVARLNLELSSAREQVARLAEKISTPESGLGRDRVALRDTVDRLNDLVSDCRTNLEVLLGLVGEIEQTGGLSPELASLLGQVTTSARLVSSTVQEIKRTAVEARNLLKGSQS